MDVYVSQSEIHMLQKAGSESMKTRACISDVDSRWKIGTFEVFLEVYQLTLLGVSTNPPTFAPILILVDQNQASNYWRDCVIELNYIIIKGISRICQGNRANL